MGLRNSAHVWGGVSRSLHWATALLVAVMIPVGWVANPLERSLTERALFDVHFSMGLLLLLLLIGRLVWRLLDRPPPLHRISEKASSL